jgi:hypothetical protein
MEEYIMAFNVNELILDRVRSLTAHDLSNGEMLFRLTSLEDPSLQTSAESEEVVDAIGALITNLYRAKKATFSASNSLISLDLAAAQFGAKKEVAGATLKDGGTVKITVPTYEIVTVAKDATEVTLKKAPVGEVKYIYALNNNEIATRYTAASAASETEFAIDEAGKITVPTGMTDKTYKLYVEYSYETDGTEKNGANRIVNKTSEFPEACSVKIYAYFRDKCNENVVYSGVIVANKAKLNPESVELALTSTGKHAFEFQMMRDYCDEEAQLFSIIVAE